MAIFRRNSGSIDAFWENAVPSEFKRLFESEFGAWNALRDDNAKKAALGVFFDEVEKQRDRVLAQEQMEDLWRRFAELHERTITDIRRDIALSTTILHERMSDVRDMARLAGEPSQRAIAESQKRPALESPARQPQIVGLPSASRGHCQYPTTKTRPEDCIRYDVRPDGSRWARCEVGDQVRANRKMPHLLTTVYTKTGCPSNRVWPKCQFIENEWVPQ